MYLGPVMVLTQIANLLPKLLEVMCTFHHLEHISGVILLLFLITMLATIFVKSRLEGKSSKLGIQCLTNFIEVIEEWGEK